MSGEKCNIVMHIEVTKEHHEEVGIHGIIRRAEVLFEETHTITMPLSDLKSKPTIREALRDIVPYIREGKDERGENDLK